MPLLWTMANAVMCLAFAFSAAVQFNDPDPIRWMAIYTAGAVISCLESVRRMRAVFPAITGGIAFAWAATIAPRVIGRVPFGSMFAEFEMHDLGVEESREMYGLLLVALWMAAVTAAAWRRQRVMRGSAGGRPG